MDIIVNIPKGTLWRPAIKVLQNDLPVDCTDKDVWMLIKEKNYFGATLFEKLIIDWTTEDEGEGIFELSEDVTKEMSVKEYYFEVFIDLEGEALLLRKGVINITESLNPRSA